MEREREGVEKVLFCDLNSTSCKQHSKAALNYK